MAKYTKLEEKISAMENRTNLVEILQFAQKEFSYLSSETLQKISELTNIPLTQIFSVASYYRKFRLNPVGKHIIKICEGMSCYVNGAAKIKQAVLSHLKIKENEMSKDKYYSVEKSFCLGCCTQSPIMMINDKIYSKLTPDAVGEILDKFRANH